MSELGDLVRGGISIVTRLDDGSVGAHFVIQLDGDVINNVSLRFLADAAAQDRHATAIGKLLAQWARARWMARTLPTLSVVAAAPFLALYPSWQVIAATLLLPFATHRSARLLYKKAIQAVYKPR